MIDYKKRAQAELQNDVNNVEWKAILLFCLGIIMGALVRGCDEQAKAEETKIECIGEIKND